MATAASCLLTAPLFSSEPKIMSQLPKQKLETMQYWKGTLMGELRYQHRTSCHLAQFPPNLQCKNCGSQKIEWRTSSRSGYILSITTVHRAPSQDFKKKTPYDIALVELDEGFRIMVNVTPVSKGKIGSKIKIFFEKKSDEISLPQASLVDKN